MTESASRPKANVSLIIMHLLLTLAAPFLVLLLSGCIDTRTAPVDYGPAVASSAVATALDSPTQNMKPTDIKVGEYMAMETSQDLALGASYNIVGASGATITGTSEDTADRRVYTGVLKTLTLQANGSFALSGQEGDILCASKTSGACGESAPAPDPCASSSSKPSDNQQSGGPQPASAPLIPSIGHQTVMSRTGSKALVKNLKYTSIDQLVTQATCPLRPPTFHHLKTWQTVESPPEKVRQQPGCLGIPNCRINVFHVSFDEVFWDVKDGDKLHVDVATSPDVPYLSRNLSVCQSLLVPVGGADSSNVLLKQCSDIFDFRFLQ